MQYIYIVLHVYIYKGHDFSAFYTNSDIFYTIICTLVLSLNNISWQLLHISIKKVPFVFFTAK